MIGKFFVKLIAWLADLLMISEHRSVILIEDANEKEQDRILQRDLSDKYIDVADRVFNLCAFRRYSYDENTYWRPVQVLSARGNFNPPMSKLINHPYIRKYKYNGKELVKDQFTVWIPEYLLEYLQINEEANLSCHSVSGSRPTDCTILYLRRPSTQEDDNEGIQ